MLSPKTELKQVWARYGMKKYDMRKSKPNRTWWLEEGTEICPACRHTYLSQTEYRCVACDGQVCVECVQHTVELEALCPDCEAPATINQR